METAERVEQALEAALKKLHDAEPLRPKGAAFEFSVLGASCVYLFLAVLSRCRWSCLKCTITLAYASGVDTAAAAQLINDERGLRRAAMPVVFLSLTFPVAFRTGFPVSDFCLVTLGLLLTMKTAVLFFVRNPLQLRHLSPAEFAASLLVFPEGGRVKAKTDASDADVRAGYRAGAARLARAAGKFALWALWVWALQRFDFRALPFFWYTIYCHQAIIAGYFFLSGAFDVQNGLIGVLAPHVKLSDIFDNPWFCTSPRDFWSNRWNTGFSVLARELIFDKYRVGNGNGDGNGHSAHGDGSRGAPGRPASGGDSRPGTPARPEGRGRAPDALAPATRLPRLLRPLYARGEAPPAPAPRTAPAEERGPGPPPLRLPLRVGPLPAPPAEARPPARLRRPPPREAAQERARAAASALAVFLYSGLMHEYEAHRALLACPPPGALRAGAAVPGDAQPDGRGRHVLFFLAHYALCIAQVALSKLLPGLRRRAPRLACLAVTWAAMIPLSPLFVAVFLEAGFHTSVPLEPRKLLAAAARLPFPGAASAH
eukprot:tig00001487_g8945.t1